MTTDQWLRDAQKLLEASRSLTARLDTLVLLEDCLGIDRARLLAHPEMTLNDSQLATLQEQVGRRARHEPLAYIRGHAEFYGRDFIVNSHVLVPRPESETMIELLKALPDVQEATGIIGDIGTGSGALAVTAACELRLAEHKFYATDIDSDCLKVAARNATALRADVTFLQGNLIEPLPSEVPIYALLCNLPYVPDDYKINDAARHEPKLALFAGADGLDYYQGLFEQISAARHRPRYILTESLPMQQNKLRKITASHDYKQVTSLDFIQLFKQ
jgi:release factor glutamine methyltransferase